MIIYTLQLAFSVVLIAVEPSKYLIFNLLWPEKVTLGANLKKTKECFSDWSSRHLNIWWNGWFKKSYCCWSMIFRGFHAYLWRTLPSWSLMAWKDLEYSFSIFRSQLLLLFVTDLGLTDHGLLVLELLSQPKLSSSNSKFNVSQCV